MIVLEISTKGVENAYVRSSNTFEEKANEVILQIIRRHLAAINEDLKTYRKHVESESKEREIVKDPE